MLVLTAIVFLALGLFGGMVARFDEWAELTRNVGWMVDAGLRMGAVLLGWVVVWRWAILPLT